MITGKDIGCVFPKSQFKRTSISRVDAHRNGKKTFLFKLTACIPDPSPPIQPSLYSVMSSSVQIPSILDPVWNLKNSSEEAFMTDSCRDWDGNEARERRKETDVERTGTQNGWEPVLVSVIKLFEEE